MSDAIVKLHFFISYNMASISTNLGGGGHDHLALTMATDNYLTQTGHAFSPHTQSGLLNFYPGNLSRTYARDRTLPSEPIIVPTVHRHEQGAKKLIVNAVDPISLSPIKNLLTVFFQMIDLEMMNYLFRGYGFLT